MSPVGNSIRGAKYLQNKLGSDYRQTKKNFDNLMKDLQKEGITKEEIDGIMMAAGSGNFSQTEYKNKIKELTDQGKHEDANKLQLQFQVMRRWQLCRLHNKQLQKQKL